MVSNLLVVLCGDRNTQPVINTGTIYQYGRDRDHVAERKPFLLRVDPAVLEAVQRWANDDLRSLNAQIEFLLRRAAPAGGASLKEKRPAKTDPTRPSR